MTGQQLGTEGEPLSQPRAVITFLKVMIGAGLLALPHACSKVNLAFAIPAMFIVAVLNALGIWRFIECKYYISRKYLQCDGIKELEEFGFGPVGGVAFHVFGRFGLLVAGATIISAQFGCCVCYIDIVTRTVAQHTDVVSTSVVRLLLGALLCVLSLVRELRELAWLSAAALGIYSCALATLVKYGIHELQDPAVESGAFLPVRWKGVGVFFGTSVFAFEGVGVAPYVYDAMQIADTTPFRNVLVISYSICLMLYAAVGGFGYWCYGDAVKDVIYENFPMGSLDVSLVEPAICIILIFSFVLQMYPVFSVAEGWLANMLPNSSFVMVPDGKANDDVPSPEVASNFSPREAVMMALVRWMVVGLSVVVATYIPQVEKMMGFVGCFAFGILGFLLPAAIHIRLCYSEMSVLSLCGDILLLACGLGALGIGIQNSLSG